MEIPVVVQHRHVHLSAEDAQSLFPGEPLEPFHPIEQRGQFILRRTVSVHGPNGSFPDVCVIGPVRMSTQVELSASDAFCLGLKAPLRVSGDLERSATVILKTPEGEIKACRSTIIPVRHLHLPPDLAQRHNVKHQDVISLRVKLRDELVFDHVIVRVHPTFTPAFHLTNDEAAPAWIQTGDIVIL